MIKCSKITTLFHSGLIKKLIMLTELELQEMISFHLGIKLMKMQKKLLPKLPKIFTSKATMNRKFLITIMLNQVLSNMYQMRDIFKLILLSELELDSFHK